MSSFNIKPRSRRLFRYPSSDKKALRFLGQRPASRPARHPVQKPEFTSLPQCFQGEGVPSRVRLYVGRIEEIDSEGLVHLRLRLAPVGPLFLLVVNAECFDTNELSYGDGVRLYTWVETDPSSKGPTSTKAQVEGALRLQAQRIRRMLNEKERRELSTFLEEMEEVNQ